MQSWAQRVAWTLAAAGCIAAASVAEDPQDQDRPQPGLAALQPYVGQWRGVGQPRRGSTRGAWREQQNWVWNFEGENAALVLEAPDAKHLRSARLETTGDDGTFVLRARPATADDESVEYRGSHHDDGRLVLTIVRPSDEMPDRISIRQVANGDRMLVLYERASPAGYVRIAEVGLTRDGSGFGQGTQFVECVVTGGLGTIPVTYQGKTYYVCCTGCRDYFNESPDQILSEYQQRQAITPRTPPKTATD